jgi:hypothetical protein
LELCEAALREALEEEPSDVLDEPRLDARDDWLAA